MSCGAQVESRTPSAVTTHEQLRLSACKSSRASVCVPCHSTLVAIKNTSCPDLLHRLAGYLRLSKATCVPAKNTNKSRTSLPKGCDIVTGCRPVAAVAGCSHEPRLSQPPFCRVAIDAI